MNEIDFERGGFGFTDFRNNHISGVDVYEIDDNGTPHLVSEVEGKTVDNIEEMTEREFGFFLAENGIM